jgi:predicted DsbA family dithiol-disulfide isomerase
MMTLGPVLHWFDFICPFCYIAQDRNRILRHAGVAVLDLPMQIHLEIGPGGAAAPARGGPMYEQLAAAAGEAGLELTWSSCVPYSRPALVAAETVRIVQNESYQAFLAAVFHAYFALAKDIEAPVVIAESAESVGVDPYVLDDEMASAAAENELRYSERRAREHHVNGTPSWVVNDDQLIVGLRSREFFIALGQTLGSPDQETDQPSIERRDR